MEIKNIKLKPHKIEVCGNCKFWRARDEEIGRCFAVPPTPVAVPRPEVWYDHNGNERWSDSRERKIRMVRPRTHAEDTCSLWTDRRGTPAETRP